MERLRATFFIIFIFVLFVLVKSNSVFAHVLKSEGSVGAVLHISPDDDPVAGQESSFYFEFKDTENRFSPQGCDCVFTVFKNGEDIYTQPLFQNNSDPSLTKASVVYTFPEKNVYTIRVTGKPTSDNAFNPFTLEYDVRVDKAIDPEDLSAPSDTGWTRYMLPGLIIFATIAYIVKVKRKGGEK